MSKVKTFLVILIIIIFVMAGIAFFYIKSTENVENTQQLVYSIKERSISLYNEADIEDIEYKGIKLLEYDNSNNDYAEIYFISYDYSTEPGLDYIVEITDEQNNNLILETNEGNRVVGGSVTDVKIKKLSLNDKFKFALFEIDEITNNVENSVQVEIDLSKDLEPKDIIIQDDIQNGKIGNVDFKYINSENVYFGTRKHYYSDNLTGRNCSIPVKIQYGKTLIAEENISITGNKNVNNLNLEEAFANLKLISEKMGGYDLSDVYGIDVWDKQNSENVGTIILNFEEMLDLCNGATIEKDGNKYTLEDLYEENSTFSMVKDDEVEIGNGIKAIKYHNEYQDYIDYSEIRYMFVDDEYIYDIKVPANTKVSDITENFLNSLAHQKEN